MLVQRQLINKHLKPAEGLDVTLVEIWLGSCSDRADPPAGGRGVFAVCDRLGDSDAAGEAGVRSAGGQKRHSEDQRFKGPHRRISS